MRKLFLSLCLLIISSFGLNAAITATIGTVTASPGDNVTIPVTISGAQGEFATATSEMFFRYNPALISTAGGSMNGYGTTMVSSEWMNNMNWGTTGDIMYNQWVTNGLVDVSIPDNTLMFNINVTYLGPGPAVIEWDLVIRDGGSFFGNFAGNFIQTNWVNGGILPAGPTLIPPVLVAPANLATDLALNSDLTWNASANATGYQVEVSTSSTFATTVISESTANLNYTLNGLNNATTYFWRVKATTASASSDWSEVRSFTTLPLAPSVPSSWTYTGNTGYTANIGLMPTGTYTVNNRPMANGDAIGVFFTSGTNSVCAGYLIWDGTSFGFTVWGDNDQTTVKDGFATGEAYTFKVWDNVLQQEFLNPSMTLVQGTSVYSNNNITVYNGFVAGVTPLAVPTLTLPTDLATEVSVNPSFSWNEVANATGYNIEVATSSDFATIVASSAVTSTTKTFEGLNNSTTYFWRVNAVNATQTSNWSAVRSFTTAVPAPLVPTVPVLSTPADLATAIAVNPTLTWGVSENTTNYTVQVSLTSDFATTIINEPVFSPYAMLTGLDNATQYFWRVKANNATLSSAWSVVRSFTTIEATPAVPVLTAPANLATGVVVNPSLDWNDAVNATSYTIEVALANDFANPIVNQVVNVSSVEFTSNLDNNTTYFWRVKSHNGTLTSAWSNTFSFTTIEATPAVVELLTPANLATGVAVNPTLTWATSANAVNYTVQVSLTNNFATTLVNEVVTTTTKALTGLNNATPYFWRVKANNGSVSSAWSMVHTFTTIEATPAVVELLTPANLATGVAVNPTLTWNAALNAANYTVQVSLTNDFATTLVSEVVTTTTKALTGLNNATPYFWRVKANNGSLSSAWSMVHSFTTIEATPAVVMLLTPANLATGIAINPTLTWETSANATSYRVQVSNTMNFTGTLLVNEVVTSTTKELANLNYAAPYFWRVQAINGTVTSAWSNVNTFTTTFATPAVVELLTPANDATNLNITPTLTWNTAANAASYRVQVSLTEDFATTLVNTVVTNTSKELPVLANLTEYFWRVQSINGPLTSDWSAIRSFTTIEATPETPAVPVLTAPADLATDVVITPTLTWNISLNATSYKVQVSTNADFTTFLVNEVVAATNKSLELANATSYFWRVQAINGTVTSAWSPVRSFTTVAAPVVVPSMQAANLVFSNVTGNSIKVRWTRGNGNNVLVVAYPSTTINATPANGTAYSVGSIIGNGVVVYNGNGRICDAMNLTSGTTYTFKAYEYFNEGLGYNVADGYLNPRSRTTTMVLSTPTALTADEVGPDNAELSWAFNGTADYYELLLAYDANFTNLVEDYVGADFGDESASLVGINSNTTFYAKVRASKNNLVSPWSNVVTFATTFTEPTIAPANVLVNNIGPNSFNVNWTNGNGQYSLVLASTNEIMDIPFDTESYEANSDYAAAQLLDNAKIVYVGTGNNFTLTGLAANTQYHLSVFTFNGANGSENYNLTPAHAEATTLSAEPTVAPTAFNVTARTATTINATWTAGNSANFIVLAKTTEGAFTGTPVDATSYTVGTTLGNATIIAVGTANTIAHTALTPNTTYYYEVFGFNGANGTENFNLTPVNGNGTTFATAPVAPATIAITARTTNTMNLTWSAVGTSKYLVLASTTPIVATPVNGMAYPTNVDNALVVYNGTATTTEVANLLPNTKYYFRAFAYDGMPMSEAYSANYAEVNGSTFATEPAAPTAITFSGVTRTAMNVAWTNNTNNLVLMNTTGVFNFEPVDGEVYTAGTNDIYYVGTNNTLELTNLTEATRYYVKVYAFNGTIGTTNYSTNSVAGDQRTRTGITQIVYVAPTATTIANGNPFNVTLELKDDQGLTLIPAANTVVTLTKTAGAGSLFGTLTATVGANGQAIFTGLTYFGSDALTLNASALGFNVERTFGVLAAMPTQQDRAILFSNVTASGMTVKWTKGNGSNRIVVMKKGGDVTLTPENGTVYPVVADYANATNDVVVYNGTGNELQLTGLTAGTYTFKVINYNNVDLPVYCTATGSFNPRSRATASKDEVAPQDELTEADINNNNFFVGTINPNPVVNNINFKMTRTEDMTMTISVVDAAGREVAKLVDGQLQRKGTETYNFNLSDNLSSGAYLLVVTAGDQTAVQTFVVVK